MSESSGEYMDLDDIDMTVQEIHRDEGQIRGHCRSGLCILDVQQQGYGREGQEDPG